MNTTPDLKMSPDLRYYDEDDDSHLNPEEINRKLKLYHRNNRYSEIRDTLYDNQCFNQHTSSPQKNYNGILHNYPKEINIEHDLNNKLKKIKSSLDSHQASMKNLTKKYSQVRQINNNNLKEFNSYVKEDSLIYVTSQSFFNSNKIDNDKENIEKIKILRENYKKIKLNENKSDNDSSFENNYSVNRYKSLVKLKKHCVISNKKNINVNCSNDIIDNFKDITKLLNNNIKSVKNQDIQDDQTVNNINIVSFGIKSKMNSFEYLNNSRTNLMKSDPDVVFKKSYDNINKDSGNINEEHRENISSKYRKDLLKNFYLNKKKYSRVNLTDIYEKRDLVKVDLKKSMMSRNESKIKIGRFTHDKYDEDNSYTKLPRIHLDNNNRVNLNSRTRLVNNSFLDLNKFKKVKITTRKEVLPKTETHSKIIFYK